MNVHEILFALMIGMSTGLASLFLGSGGGLIIVPLLPLIANISARGAIGTSLLSVCLISSFNAWNFHKKSLISWKTVGALGIFAATGSFLAGRLTAFVSDFALQSVFAGLLLGLAFRTLRHLWKLRHPHDGRKVDGAGEEELESLDGMGPSEDFIEEEKKPNKETDVSSKKNRAKNPELKTKWAALIGLCMGFVSGFTGIGGGVVLVPFLSVFGWVKQKNIVPTSVATITITSAFGVLAFILKNGSSGSQEISTALQAASHPLQLGVVRLDLALAIVLAGMTTAHFAKNHREKLSPQKRDLLIAILLLSLSTRLLFVLIKTHFFMPVFGS